MIKAVIFDLDGTLVYSLEDLAISTNYALNLFGFGTHETEKYKYFVGDGMQKLIERVLPEENRDSETKVKVFDAFINYYSQHYLDKTIAYDGIHNVLDELKKMGYNIDKKTIVMDHIIDSLGVHEVVANVHKRVQIKLTIVVE